MEPNHDPDEQGEQPIDMIPDNYNPHVEENPEYWDYDDNHVWTGELVIEP